MHRLFRLSTLPYVLSSGIHEVGRCSTRDGSRGIDISTMQVEQTSLDIKNRGLKKGLKYAQILFKNVSLSVDINETIIQLPDLFNVFRRSTCNP